VLGGFGEVHPNIRDYGYPLYGLSGSAAGRDLDNWLEPKARLCSGTPKAEGHLCQHQNLPTSKAEAGSDGL
jgi:hypothetical protein